MDLVQVDAWASLVGEVVGVLLLKILIFVSLCKTLSLLINLRLILELSWLFYLIYLILIEIVNLVGGLVHLQLNFLWLILLTICDIWIA